MQSLPVTAAIPQLPASNSASGVSPDGDSAGLVENADFGALLEQQINGLAAHYQLGEVGLPLAAEGGDTAGKKLQLRQGADDSSVQTVDLNAAAGIPLTPLAGFVQLAPADGKLQTKAQATPTASGVAGVAINKFSDISFTPGTPADAGAEKTAMAVQGRAGVLAAEFAADGKLLPRVASEKSQAAVAVIPLDSRGDRTVLDPAAGLPRFDAPVSLQVPAAAPPAASVAPTVGAPGWGDAVGQKVVWMATERQQVAELHLNPPNLGPLEVRLSFSGDQTSALFVSHHPAVRDAIESALPRLREMLADSGIMLGNAMVSAESFSQQQPFFQEDGRPAREGGATSMGGFDPVISRGALTLRSDGSGLVDIFA